MLVMGFISVVALHNNDFMHILKSLSEIVVSDVSHSTVQFFCHTYIIFFPNE